MSFDTSRTAHGARTFTSLIYIALVGWQVIEGCSGVVVLEVMPGVIFVQLAEPSSAKKIANVLGPEIFEVLGLPRPNPYLQKINQVFERFSPEHQQKLAEDAERYEANNISKTSKQRKTSSHP